MKSKFAFAFARGWALFLAVYFLANLAGSLWRARFDSTEWVLNFAGLPAIAETLVTGGAAIALLAFGITPRFARNRIAISLIAGAMVVSIFNVIQFYRLLRIGWISTMLPIPLALFTTVLLAGILLAIRRGAEERPSRLFIAFNFAAALILFPIAQMIFFGTTDYSRQADAIVVFGARTYKDGRPSDALKDRVRTACELFRAGRAPVVVMSGGPSEGAIHETEAMRDYAILHGVPARAIVLDPNGLNTAATIRNLDTLAAARHWHRILAVSHGYHLPRVKLAAQRHGLTVYTVPARSPQILAKLPLFMARETAGWWLYFLREA